jgi:hypothetical protein
LRAKKKKKKKQQEKRGQQADESMNEQGRESLREREKKKEKEKEIAYACSRERELTVPVFSLESSSYFVQIARLTLCSFAFCDVLLLCL